MYEKPMQINPLNFANDCKLMDCATTGAYMLLLCHEWYNGYLPMNIKQLRKIAPLPEKKMKKLLQLFYKKDQKYFCVWLEKDRGKEKFWENFEEKIFDFSDEFFEEFETKASEKIKNPPTPPSSSSSDILINNNINTGKEEEKRTRDAAEKDAVFESPDVLNAKDEWESERLKRTDSGPVHPLSQKEWRKAVQKIKNLSGKIKPADESDIQFAVNVLNYLRDNQYLQMFDDPNFQKKLSNQFYSKPINDNQNGTFQRNNGNNEVDYLAGAAHLLEARFSRRKTMPGADADLGETAGNIPL